MKNLNYFPYERNKYFYGKLLSVDDFESEQKYMNDKRRLINRFMHGCGVVCGLGVVPVGDDTISLEAGLALDFSGREILVEKPVLKKISDIDGFSKNMPEQDKCQYLCIEYSEYEKDPVYNVAGISPDSGPACYNKTAEGYHIYLTSQEPEQGAGTLTYYEEAKTIYRGNGIRIRQIFPKYVKSGSEFDFRLIVENMGQKLPISFGYELALECLSKDRKKWLKIIFDEEQQEKAGHYEIPVTVRASDVRDIKGRASLKDGSFWLKAGEHVLEDGAHANTKSDGYPARTACTVNIIAGDVQETVSQSYFAEAMQEVLDSNYHQSIYLARINLIQAKDTVVIEETEPMPFGQYICSDILSSIREKTAEDELKYLKRRLAEIHRDHTEEASAKITEFPADVPMTAEGVVTLELGIGGLAGQKFFSRPISHGLGLGDTTVLCGLACGEKDRYLCSGADDIFEEESMVHGKLAVRADRTEGTFVVGLKLTEPTTAERVNVHWMALRERRDAVSEKEQRELFLKPDMVYLSLREDYYFEAIFTGAGDRRILWSIREPGGGTIDENGMYTAPDAPGIYEIIAKSAAWQDITASAFAVVRDTKGRSSNDHTNHR